METARRESGDILASDTERQRSVATLQAACVEGRLSLDEYGQRVETALAARTRAQLDLLTTDLPADMARSASDQRHLARAPSADSASTGRSVSATVAVLGSAHRSGFWRLTEASQVIAVLGSCRIDLRSARISAAVTTLDVAAVLGSVDVIVPAGVEVDLEVMAFLGSRDLRVAAAPPAPGAPVVRITGFVLLGSLNVRDATASPGHIDTYG